MRGRAVSAVGVSGNISITTIAATGAWSRLRRPSLSPRHEGDHPGGLPRAASVTSLSECAAAADVVEADVRRLGAGVERSRERGTRLVGQRPDVGILWRVQGPGATVGPDGASCCAGELDDAVRSGMDGAVGADVEEELDVLCCGEGESKAGLREGGGPGRKGEGNLCTVVGE